MSTPRLLSRLGKLWNFQRSTLYTNANTRLCKRCIAIIVDQQILGSDIPESPLPNGTVGLDLNRGYVNLHYKHKDTYPQMQILRASAADGCNFCEILADSIDKERNFHPELWDRKFKDGSYIYIRLRYNCAVELGTQSFGNGQWPTMLSSIEACISHSLSSAEGPIILVFKLHCDSGMSWKISALS
jgi:hypothetical protein